MPPEIRQLLDTKSALPALNMKGVGVRSANHGSYGADPQASGAVNSGAIDEALSDAKADGGGIVTVRKPGVYPLASQGANPHEGSRQYAVDFGDGTTGVYLVAGPGVEFKVADDQANDADGLMEPFVGKNLTRCGLIAARPYAARVFGNTAGQTNYTQGYSQTSGALLHLYAGSASPNRKIVVSGFQMDDHFSNPVQIEGVRTGTPSDRILLQHLLGLDCGEGFLVAGADYVKLDAVRYEDRANVAAGDAMELSACENFHVTRCSVDAAVGGGSGGCLDLFASKHGLVSDFDCERWSTGISHGTNASGRFCDDIYHVNNRISNVGNPGAYSTVGETGDITIVGGGGEGLTGTIAQFTNVAGSGADGVVKMIGTDFRQANNGVLIRQDQDAVLRGNTFVGEDDGSGRGINPQGSGRVVVTGNDCSKFQFGVRVDGSPAAGSMITDNDFTDNSDSDPINLGPAGDLSNLVVRDNLPLEAPADFDADGYEYLIDPGSTVTDLPTGTKRGRLTIVCETVSRVVEDKSQGAGNNIALRAGEQFRMTEGNSITVEYRHAVGEWQEVARGEPERKGHRLQTIDGWWQDDVSASQSNAALSRYGGAQTREFIVPRGGHLRAIGMRISEAQTGGTLTLEYWKNNGGPNETVVIDTNGQQYARATFQRQANPINAEDRIELRISTDGSWAPNTADLHAWIEVEY